LHVIVAALALLGVMSWRDSEPVAQRLAIEARVVSAAPSRLSQPPPPPPEVVTPPEPVVEPEPQPDPEQVAREKAQAEAVARREEEQRVLTRKAEEARLQQVREKEEKATREKEHQEKAAREKLEREQREKAEREKAEREKTTADKERQKREAELNAQIAAEERLAAARASGKMDQYAAQITARIERAWIRPPGARPGLECEVRVTQVPGGAVVGARVTRCNGDDAVRESIEAAVYRASPLPQPADAALFERNLVVTFRPED
jgi:colicin import membrane protein